MEDHHAVSILIRIPPFLLTILKEEALVAIAFVVDDVCHGLGGDGGHVGDFSSFGQFDEVKPATEVALVGCVGGGGIAGVVVASSRHDSPIFRCVGTAIVNIIEVHHTEAVRELVAGRTDAGQSRVITTFPSIDFLRAGIAVHFHTVKIATMSVIPNSERMRPNAVRTVAAITFGIAGIDDVEVFHLSVAVPVIVGKIHLGIHRLGGFKDHVRGVSVVAGTAVAAIVCHVGAHSHRAHHVKSRSELTVGLVSEIIGNTAVGTFIVETLLVEHAVEEFASVV